MTVKRITSDLKTIPQVYPGGKAARTGVSKGIVTRYPLFLKPYVIRTTIEWIFASLNEELLYHVWKFRAYRKQELISTCNEKLSILDPGERNQDAGSDFFNASIRIGKTRWAGNVEIHTRSSDWIAHGHMHDPAYDNVILHVVYDHDREVHKSNGERVMTLELKGLVPEKIIARYNGLKLSTAPVPCHEDLEFISPLIYSTWVERLVLERLEKRTAFIRMILEKNSSDWENCFYQVLARAFGFRVNAEPFEILGRILPLRILNTKRDSSFVLESLIFGQSGLLEAHFSDDYAMKLQNEFALHRKKHDLTPMDPSNWKFMRLRPRNFPTLRLSQFATVIFKHENMVSKIIDSEELESVTGMFNVNASAYWQEHFMFDKKVRKMQASMGWESATLIVINAIIPFLFVYGKERGREDLIERAIRFLEEIRPENNTLLRQWSLLGLKAKNALQSQGLIQLRNEYCNRRRCLDCAIGVRIMSEKHELLPDKS